MTSINGSDVFEAAIGMERTGMDFYEALGMGSDDNKVRDFCEQAARDEGRHLATFQHMRKQWTHASGVQPVESEQAAALTALAKKQIQPDPTEVRKVAIGGKLKDALNMAMEMEQDAIDFYQKLQAHLPDSAQAIQGIVGEEKKHLASLRSLVGQHVGA